MGILKTVIDVVWKITDCFAMGLGLDKPIKDGQSLLKESLTFKGGIFDKKIAGDNLQRELANQRAKSNEKLLDELRLIREELNKRGDFQEKEI